MQEISFGEWLCRQRKMLGLTQQQLAAQLNCATITVRKIEAEQRRPSVQMVEQLAQILNIPPKEHDDFLRFARGYEQPVAFTAIEPYPWSTPTRAVSLQNQSMHLAGIVGDHYSSAWKSGPVRSDIHSMNLTTYPEVYLNGLSQETIKGILEKINSGGYILLLVPIEMLGQAAESSLQSQNFFIPTGTSSIRPNNALFVNK